MKDEGKLQKKLDRPLWQSLLLACCRHPRASKCPPRQISRPRSIQAPADPPVHRGKNVVFEVGNGRAVTTPITSQLTPTARMVIKISAAIEPRKTGTLPYFMARIIATKNVLSPNSPMNISPKDLPIPTKSGKGATGLTWETSPVIFAADGMLANPDFLDFGLEGTMTRVTTHVHNRMAVAKLFMCDRCGFLNRVIVPSLSLMAASPKTNSTRLEKIDPGEKQRETKNVKTRAEIKTRSTNAPR